MTTEGLILLALILVAEYQFSVWLHKRDVRKAAEKARMLAYLEYVTCRRAA